MEKLKDAFEEAKNSSLPLGSKLSIDMAYIMKEYETLINFLERASTTADFLRRDQIKETFRCGTIRNLDECRLELQSKLNNVEKENQSLLDEIDKLKLERKLYETGQNLKIEAFKVKHLQGKGCSGLTGMGLCKMLNLHQTDWADKNILLSKLEELQSTGTEIEKSLSNCFVSKKKYATLFKQVLEKEIQCEAYGHMNKTLKTKVKRFKIAIEAAEICSNHQEYQPQLWSPKTTGVGIFPLVDQVISTFVRVQTSNEETGDQSIENDDEEEAKQQEFLRQFGFSTLRRSPDVENEGDENEEDPLSDRLKKIERPKSFDVKKSFTDDDPLKEQEAEMTMDYVEVFSNLFTAQEYERAAMHAIYSPKGILRTQQTLQYFKNIDIKNKSASTVPQRSYLLHYCKLLMATVTIIGKEPTVWEVIESFRSAINENCLDLVEYWIARDTVPIPEPVASLLFHACVCQPGSCKCRAVSLAEAVYRKLGSYHELIHLMIHQGRLATAVHFADEQAKYSAIDYARMLEEKSTCERLSTILVKQLNAPQCRQIIAALVCSSSHENAVILAKRLTEKDTVVFHYKDFVLWQGPISIAESFIKLCNKEGLHELNESFLASCMVWCSLFHSQFALTYSW